jgi:WD40 repeat protein
MSCCLSPDGQLIASGGMDNICTIHNVRSSDGAKIIRELLGFEGFLSCIRFLDDGKLLTSSADGNIFMWDIETGSKISAYRGHANDVLSFSVADVSKNTFVSGSVDDSAKVSSPSNGIFLSFHNQHFHSFGTSDRPHAGKHSGAILETLMMSM